MHPPMTKGKPRALRSKQGGGAPELADLGSQVVMFKDQYNNNVPP